VAFPRSVVEGVGDLIAAALGDVLHGRSFREILANETVGVLVGTSFPGMVWSGEVDLHSSELLDLPVTMKLRSVISGDGFEEVRAAIDDLEEPLVESVDGVVR